jgi:hypothetical protein
MKPPNVAATSSADAGNIAKAQAAPRTKAHECEDMGAAETRARLSLFCATLLRLRFGGSRPY